MLDGDVQPTISSLIVAVERGDKAASETLFGLLYSELHRVAKRELGRGVEVLFLHHGHCGSHESPPQD